MADPPRRWPGSYQIDTRKITDYLLNPDHVQGASKATFFGRFGFRRDEPDVLAFALLEHAVPSRFARDVFRDGDTRLHFEGAIRSPDGRNPRIRTVWQVDAAGTAWFLTAYPRR